MYKHWVTLIWSAALLIGVTSSLAQAQDSGWPRTLPLEGGTVTIYPLQVDDLNGDRLHFRAALAYRPTGVSEPVFGAGWFESRAQIDRSKGIVHPVDLTVSNTRFPAGTDDLQAELAAVLAQQAPGWNLDFPLNELETALETVEQEEKAVQNLNTAPPNIIYRDHPALLVNIDGKPVLRSIENSSYQAVINTPYPLIFDGRSYYLSAAEGAWYRAENATGPYRFDTSPPSDIVEMVEAAAKAEADPTIPAEKITAANAPEIVVATSPSELIVTEGPAQFVPLVDDLLVLDNSADDVFMHISSQQYYVVLAGRWYQAPSLNGPWTYRAANALPVAFTKIPGNSDQSDSRVYVAGTDEAKEAVLDAQIPVTAAVARGPGDVDVTYDGDPSFEPVQGTDLEYADNTSSTVIQSDRQYFLVEDGVWYVSSSPNGPWEVSDYRPEEVAAIAPESPVYNVKYVYIYDSTPEYVYVGYTPGYLGSYIYHDTIVYGTGWYYRPWISPYYYYPRYSTWGFNVGYDSWSGWSFGLSWGWGPFYAGFYSGGYWHDHHYWNHGGYGYWGPGGYRPRWGHHDRYGHGGNRYGHGDYGRGGYGRGDYGRGDYGGRGYGRGNDDRDYDRGYAGRDHGRGGFRGRGYDRGDYRNDDSARSPDLYRARGQRARVTQPGDFRQGTRQGGPDRMAQEPAPAGREGFANRDGRSVREPGKAGPSRTGPVTPSDLRAKAANRDELRNRLIAENNQGARRSSQSPVERSETRGRNPAAVAREGIRSRTTLPGSDQNGRQAAAEQLASRGVNQPGAPRQRPVQQRGTAREEPRQREIRGREPAGRTPEQLASRGTIQPGDARPRSFQQSGAPRQEVPQRAAQPRSAPPQMDREQYGSRRGMQQRGMQQQRDMPPQLARQQAAPERAMQQQRGMPPRMTREPAAPERAMQQGSAPPQMAREQAVPQRAMQPRGESRQQAPRSDSRQASARSGDGGRERGHGGRPGGNSGNRGDRGNSGRH